jgi:spermidine/putrescine transport system substrate-binding protein
MKDRDSKIQTIMTGYRRGFLSRREALRALGAVGLAAGAAPLLDFAALADEAGKQAGPGGIPLSRPDKPVTLPLTQDPIKSGLEPEKGPFHIFNYQDYIDQVSVIDTFSKKYGVEVVLTTFDSMDQAITRLASGTVECDATNITPDRLAQGVAGKLLQPINHSYVPNLEKNIFKSLTNPFYDQGSQYSVPYNLYSTGIGWRTDKVKVDIGALENPWSIFWDAKSSEYSGYTGIMDDARESLGMAMLYRGQYDVNTEDAAELEKALADLKATVPISNPKINITQYQTLADGSSWIHQAWSGDMLGAIISYWPEGQDKSLIKYWWPGKGKGVTQNDCWAVLAKAKNPVLAHLWLNHICDAEVAYNNTTTYTGYQPAQKSFNADELIKAGILPEQLKNIILTEEDVGAGSLQYCALTSEGQKKWQDAYAKFNSGSE